MAITGGAASVADALPAGAGTGSGTTAPAEVGAGSPSETTSSTSNLSEGKAEGGGRKWGSRSAGKGDAATAEKPAKRGRTSKAAIAAPKFEPPVDELDEDEDEEEQGSGGPGVDPIDDEDDDLPETDAGETPAGGESTPAEAVTAPAVSPAEWNQALINGGIPVSADPSQAVHQVAGLYQNALDLQRENQAMRAQLQQLQQQQANPAQAAQPGAAPAAAAPAAHPFGLPQYDPQWEQLVNWERDEDGNVVPVPVSQYVDQTIPGKLLAHQRAQAQTLQQIVSDPQGMIYEKVVKPQVEQLIAQAMDRRFGEFQASLQANGIYEQNASWLTQRGADGQAVTDPLTGRPMLSEHGRNYMQSLEFLAELAQNPGRLADPNLQHQLAIQLAGLVPQPAAATMSAAASTAPAAAAKPTGSAPAATSATQAATPQDRFRATKRAEATRGAARSGATSHGGKSDSQFNDTRSDVTLRQNLRNALRQRLAGAGAE